MSDRRGDPRGSSADEDLARAIGKAIGIRRLELGLKRNDLRDRSRLSYPYIAELENGTKRGSTKALTAISHALELSVSELMERAELLRDQAFGPLHDEAAERLEPTRRSWFADERARLGTTVDMQIAESQLTADFAMPSPELRTPSVAVPSYQSMPSRDLPVGSMTVRQLEQLIRRIVRQEVEAVLSEDDQRRRYRRPRGRYEKE